MSSNVSKECPFCGESKVSHHLFKHIIKLHPERLFDEDTQDGRLNRLHLKSSDKKPLHIKAKEIDLYCCMGCSRGAVRECYTRKHFPECLKAHTEAVKALAEKYPNTRPVFNKPGATTDLSGSVVITSTTTTTTRIEAPNPEVLAYVLRQLQTDVNVARDYWNHGNKKLARLAKKYNIPEREIDEISNPSESDPEEPEQSSNWMGGVLNSLSFETGEDEAKPKKEKVPYDKEPKYKVMKSNCLKRWGHVVGFDTISQEDVDKATTDALKKSHPELFASKKQVKKVSEEA